MSVSKKKSKGVPRDVVIENDNVLEYTSTGIDPSNEAIIIPGQKRKGHDEEKGNKKKKKCISVEKEKERVTKKMKRELTAVQRRKAQKITQEELFVSLAEFQLDTNKLKQLGSTAHMQDKDKCQTNDSGSQFPEKLKAFSGKMKLKPTVHYKERKQENYYPTDDESDIDDDESTENMDTVSPVETDEMIEEKPSTSKLDASDEHRIQEPVEETIKRKKKVRKNLMKRVDDHSDGEYNEIPLISTNSQEGKERVGELKQEPNDDDLSRAQPDSPATTSTAPTRKPALLNRDPGMETKRALLPIYAEEVTIVEKINENIVTVVCGETGSGKTTQIPQFLYEAGYTSNGQLIGITEPRRVAAISMAKRVGEEMNSLDLVSYQIRYEGNRTDSTEILYMTDGVLMKEMETDIMLNKYSVIVIDEAHERSMYSDVLIGMLSRIAPLRAKTDKPLKLVIMSATLRLDDFLQKRLFPKTPAVIKVDARQFPVTVHFEKRTPEDYVEAALRKVCRIHEQLPEGTILLFVSGQNEVRSLVNRLKKRYPVKYEETEDGGLTVINGKTWKKRQEQKSKTMKLEDFKEELEKDCNPVAELDGEDYLEQGVGDMWDDYEEEFDPTEETTNSLGAPPPNTRPLYCLPLYSLLSTEKQQRVFQPPPEGTRMCVITTNVAETSLTIPGVKFVVDSGFEKRRLYDPVTGVSQFVVCRVSQASADQRAGRAGRIAAGHAYRLYSSAVFQDFAKFSRPEIMDKPADQLVLHLKSMNIVKVVNFPFPSAPEEDALIAAENRLTRLGALTRTQKNGKTEARITALGKTLSVFPLAPAYAKVIAMANQHHLMEHAILLIAALSVREPLVPVGLIRGPTEEETKRRMTELLKLRKGWLGKGPSRRLGDLLVLMRAVTESVKMNNAECERIGVRPKAMVEIRKLRTQLTNIVNTSFKTSEDVVMNLQLEPPTDTKAQMLRQMMVSGLADRIARRVDRSRTEVEVPRGAYQSTKLEEYVFLDPSSVMLMEEPDFVLYQEIVELGGKKCMQMTMSVDEDWLTRLAEGFCRFDDGDKETEPRFDSTRDMVVRNVKAWFGPLDWPLKNVDRAIPNDIMLYRYFGQFLLSGEVCSVLKKYVKSMIAPPTTMIRAWAKLQQRTEMLLNALVDKEVTSRCALVEEFNKNENYLLQEYLEWIPQSLQAEVTMMWPPLEEHEKSRKIGRNKVYSKP